MTEQRNAISPLTVKAATVKGARVKAKPCWQEWRHKILLCAWNDQDRKVLDKEVQQGGNVLYFSKTETFPVQV